MEYDEIVNQIAIQTNIDKEKVENLIETKRNTMSGLLTPLGAAALIAKEKGITVEEKDVSSQPKISDLTPNLDGLNIVGRIVRIFPTNTFVRKNGNPGKVANVLLSDGNSQIRVAFWNDQCDEFIPNLKIGDILKIIDTRTKEGWQGQIEATIGYNTKVVVNPIEDSDIRIKDLPPIDDIQSDFKLDRVVISDLKDQDKYKEVLATLVKFYRCTLFESCPNCFKSVDEDSICQECGKVTPKKKCVVECGIDDTTGFMRAVFFDKNAERLLNKPTKEIWDKVVELLDSGLDKREAGLTYLNENCSEILGKDYLFSGKVEENEFSGLNMKVYSTFKPDPTSETKKLLEKI